MANSPEISTHPVTMVEVNIPAPNKSDKKIISNINSQYNIKLIEITTE